MCRWTGTLPQLEAVVRYEAGALAPFAPAYLEYSFNGLGVEYAGRPLGGRIDRVDVDAEGRAMVIDYKHRMDVNAFKLADPTVAKRDGAVPADDPDWLPEHTQSLIYAQALRHSELALDARGALYFSTKGGAPAMRGAVSEEFVEVESGDGRVPGLRTGFPDAEHGGTMGFTSCSNESSRPSRASWTPSRRATSRRRRSRAHGAHSTMILDSSGGTHNQWTFPPSCRSSAIS